MSDLITNSFMKVARILAAGAGPNATEEELVQAEQRQLREMGEHFDRLAATAFTNPQPATQIDTLEEVGLKLDAAATQFITGQLGNNKNA